MGLGMVGVWSCYHRSLTDHSIEEITTILRRLPQTVEGVFLCLLLFRPRACVRIGLSYHQTIISCSSSGYSSVTLQALKSIGLAKRWLGVCVRDRCAGTCRWNMSIRQASRSMFGKLSSTRSSDEARRTCFDRLHARVSNVERQSKLSWIQYRKVQVKHGPRGSRINS